MPGRVHLPTRLAEVGVVEQVEDLPARNWMPQQGAATSLCHQADLKDIRSFSKVDDARDVAEIEITMASHENHLVRASGEDQAQSLLQVLNRDGLLVDGELTVLVYAD